MDNLAQMTTAKLPESNLLLALVVDNNDPTRKQRIRVTVPGLLEAADVKELPWVLPKAQSPFGVGDDYGVVQIPRIGSRVYVHFQGGDLSFGQYVSDALTSRSALPADFLTHYPNRFGYYSPKGDILYTDLQTRDTVFKHSSGSAVHFASDGSVTMYVKGKLTEIVDGDYAQVVKGTVSISVEGDHSLSVQGQRSEVIQGSSTTNVSGSTSELTSGERTISCSKESHAGDIEVMGDVKASGISLRYHVHVPTTPLTTVPQ